MPELPEVETIVRDLNNHVVGRGIIGAWSERPATIKTHSIADLQQAVTDHTITGARRRAKYILIDLSDNLILAMHQKMAGHLLYGHWTPNPDKEDQQLWLADTPGTISDDPYNRFIRFILFLNNGQMLALSDVRRFSRVYLTTTDTFLNTHDFAHLGPEPLDATFTADDFIHIMHKKKGFIKKTLMDPYIIAGIGNIYADEMLWYSNIHPLSRVERLSHEHLHTLYAAMRHILQKGIDLCGHSEMNYRTLHGTKGSYQDVAYAYQRTGLPCSKQDGGILQKISINHRSAHFCPIHQHLY